MNIANRSSEDDVIAGVRLFGLDAEVHRKIEAKRDHAYERQVCEWVAAVTGIPLSDDCDIVEYLKSGIVLCKYPSLFFLNLFWINERYLLMLISQARQCDQTRFRKEVQHQVIASARDGAFHFSCSQCSSVHRDFMM